MTVQAIETAAPRTAWGVLELAGASIPSTSVQYIQVPVRASSGNVPYNPTALPVAMAFINGSGKPSGLDWQTAAWAWTSSNDNYYACQILVGTGSVTLAVGTYQVWVQVTGSPEIPVMPSGSLTIY